MSAWTSSSVTIRHSHATRMLSQQYALPDQQILIQAIWRRTTTLDELI